MSNLPSIDLRVGEARLVRDIACELFDLETFNIKMNPCDWEYQPHGYSPLVKFLEDKYAANVIVTNGANQALHAVIKVLKNKHYKNLGIRSPYWNRIPDIAKHVGIGCTTFQNGLIPEDSLGIDSYFLTMPNNPDGYIPSLDSLRELCKVLKEKDIPLIHDAVYYNRSYLPVDYPTENIGNVQIFSASKSYGLSSLRVGYIVVYDASFYRLLKNYIEFSTVGVSIAAQKTFLHILKRENQLSFLRDKFESLSREAVKKSRNLFKQIKTKHIELPENYDKVSSMFGWVKVDESEIFEKLNIEVLPGVIFGAPGYCRINLAAGYDLITEVVRRVNSF